MKQTVSREIAGKLNIGGFPQRDTYFAWERCNTHFDWTVTEVWCLPDDDPKLEWMAAPLLSEILELLPESAIVFRPLTVNTWDHQPRTTPKWMAAIAGRPDYCCMSENFIDTQFSKVQFDDNPANAAALLWLELQKPKEDEED